MEVSPLRSDRAPQVTLKFRPHALRSDCKWSVSPSAAINRVHEINTKKSASTTCRPNLMHRHQQLVNAINTHLLQIQANHACVVWKYKFIRIGVTLNLSKNSDLEAKESCFIESREVIIILFQLCGPHFHFVCQNVSRRNTCAFIQAQYLGMPRF